MEFQQRSVSERATEQVHVGGVYNSSIPILPFCHTTPGDIVVFSEAKDHCRWLEPAPHCIQARTTHSHTS